MSIAKRFNLSFCILLLGIATLVCAKEEQESREKLQILNPEDLSAWSGKEFSGQTHYQKHQTQPPVRTVIKAQSQASASGLFREIRVDLTKTPYLNWSWRVENTLQQTDETKKQGDDYPARIYVVVSGGLWFWKTKALNYVWSSQQAVNTDWPNAFTANAHMLAVDSGQDKINTWVQHRRNVLRDIKTYLNLDVQHIDAVAIMTDTDNSGQSAMAYYGEIYFSD